MKKVLVIGLLALLVFSMFSAVTWGAPGMSGDPVNGTTDEEGLSNSTVASNDNNGGGEANEDTSSPSVNTDNMVDGSCGCVLPQIHPWTCIGEERDKDGHVRGVCYCFPLVGWCICFGIR